MNRFLIRHLILTLLTTSMIPGTNTFLQAQSRVAELDSVLMVLQRDSLFTGVLLIGRNGETLYNRAIGEYENRTLTTRTPLPLASVTKPMTAAAVLSLVEEGLLDLDAPVSGYLSDWPYPDVTVRHLLNQTSGIHFLTTINAYADTTRSVRNSDVLALIAKHKPGLVFTPGSAFTYDNANYVALASLLEIVTGQPFAEILMDRVFGPAGMDSARVTREDESGASWLQWIGAGGIVASAEDLLAFDHAFFGGDLVSSELVNEARTPPAFSDSTQRRYGFGWFLTKEPESMIGHFGDGEAAKTGLWRENEDETTYIILMPGDAIQRTDILGAVIQLWNGEPYTLPQRRPVAQVPEEVLSRYVGVYDSAIGRLHITLQNGQLHLEPEGAGGSEPLIPASETVFYFGHQDLSWEFVLDPSGKVTGLMLQNHPETLGKKAE